MPTIVRKTELKPTTEQQALLRQWYGIARYSYNLALATSTQHYTETQKSLSAYELRKIINHDESQPQWFVEAPSKIKANAILNLGRAMTNFYQKRAAFPRFKTRKHSKQSFTTDGAILVQRNAIRLPVIGWINLKEYGYLPIGVKINSATVSEVASHTYISVTFTVPETEPVPRPNGAGIGLDLGVKDLAIASDGTRFTNINRSQRLKMLTKRLKREQRKLARRYRKNQQQSKNYYRQKDKVAALHARITRIRAEHHRQVVTQLMRREPSFITIEDLNVSGMLKNRHLSRAIAEQGLFSLVQWLVYQCRKYGVELRQVGRFYPSTKRCSSCGSIQSISLAQRTYRCSCGLVVDRDVNAALNLENATDYVVLVP